VGHRALGLLVLVVALQVAVGAVECAWACSGEDGGGECMMVCCRTVAACATLGAPPTVSLELFDRIGRDVAPGILAVEAPEVFHVPKAALP
jgi:hypothetical protein